MSVAAKRESTALGLLDCGAPPIRHVIRIAPCELPFAMDAVPHILPKLPPQ
jgi:hypothetical protein